MLRQTGFQVALFLGSLVLFSWPFWSAPESRGIGFAYVYYFGVWGFLVLILLVFGQRPGQKQADTRKRGETPEDDV